MHNNSNIKADMRRRIIMFSLPSWFTTFGAFFSIGFYCTYLRLSTILGNIVLIIILWEDSQGDAAFVNNFHTQVKGFSKMQRSYDITPDIIQKIIFTPMDWWCRDIQWIVPH